MDFWWQRRGRSSRRIMGGAEQILPASFSPTDVFSWGLGEGCTCETPQTFQNIWYVRELCLSKPCIKMAGLAFCFINCSPGLVPGRAVHGWVLLRTTSGSAPWLCLESGVLQSSHAVVSCSAPNDETAQDAARGRVPAGCLTKASHTFGTAS